MAKAAKKNVVATVSKKDAYGAAIDALINSMAKRGSKLKEDAHKALVMIFQNYSRMIEHKIKNEAGEETVVLRPNGDISRLVALQTVIRANHGSAAVKALNEWIVVSVPSLKFVEKDENGKTINQFRHITGTTATVAETVKIKRKTTGEVYEGNPYELSFFELEVKGNEVPFSLEAKIKALLKSATNEANKLKEKGDIDGMRKLTKQIEMIENLHVENVKIVDDGEGHKSEDASNKEMPAVAA